MRQIIHQVPQTLRAQNPISALRGQSGAFALSLMAGLMSSQALTPGYAATTSTNNWHQLLRST